MNRSDRIYIAGHGGLVGSALVRCLQSSGFENLLLRSRSQVDLRASSDVDALFRNERPDIVLLAAATVGGIQANRTKPADFIRDNLQIQTNVIDASHRYGVRKLLFLGSSCIYPRSAPQPMSENALLTGPLEPTNEWYAIAKIAGLKMCQAYRQQYGFDAITVMPTNLYGPNDNFDLESSHVLPALMRKFHDAKLEGASEVVVWGSGRPRREFLHVDDLADACLFLMDGYSSALPVNIGWGTDISIGELAQLIRDVVGFDGEIAFDTMKPDGAPRKLLDVSRIQSLGWSPKIPLQDGVRSTYDWYRTNQAVTRR